MHTPLNRALAASMFSLAAAFFLVSPVCAHSPGGPPEQLGTVEFANSCSPEVQSEFLRGVALLHSFWWQEGGKAFREVLARDPACAIAAWGIAAINIGNTFSTGASAAGAQEASQAIERARAIGPKTERERYYIEAVNEYYEQFSARTQRQRMQALAKAFGQVASKYPDDDEAQIFYAIYLAATQDPKDKTFAATLKAAGILEIQFAKHPGHPGAAHYLIHSYDYPPIAEKGLKAARRYAEIAPSAPHALHMPSHIFTRVGAWADSAATNRRSANVAKAQNEPGDALHAMDYLVYADLQLARDRDADAVLAEARRVASNNRERAGTYALQAIPARIALEHGDWSAAMQLNATPSPFPYVDAMTRYARALGAARSGDAAAAEQEAAELTRLAEKLKTAKDDYWTTEVEAQRMAAAAWAEFAKGKRDQALVLMRAAADLEDTSEKSAISPGRLVPARELLGDMLRESGLNSEALLEYERSLVRDPNRFRGLYGAGRAAVLAGNRDKARYYFEHLVAVAGKGEARRELVEAREYLARA